ncbi:zinc finger protein GAI-ASSOCIATED FACTOR 1-like [Actinidia eriantha]|uniref:zinc finger protein GAI-ASSOCIATED FACTOR 1-like n=1 Tax=Actinidia eriantha TaxID=165200 RepID=UPI0025908C74|nr:zinc finger protein GAI-ASSOCIATED FACTOR 1-like [Actinidia eriantha]
MPADLDNSSAMNESTASGEASVSSSLNQMAPPKPEKKRRNLAGMPDPDAEVIALSPRTLLATNRFICEICNKGFQRDQNLQLHRRGHNLPWKLRQRSSNEVRKRVYVCPEPSCVHHDPSRALGDLTGIKKHFCRKHGEKKWKCEKCSKKYAVQSDWKAHLKVCGTREYKCDCGTLFSRRDSFITHRAFCDALAVESAKAPPSLDEDPKLPAVASSPPTSLPPPTLSPSSAAISSALPFQSPELPENPIPAQILDDARVTTGLTGSCSSTSGSSSNGSTSSSVFTSLFASSTASASLQSQPLGFTDLIRVMACPERAPDLTTSSSTESISLCLATNHGSSIFGPAGQERRQYAPPPQPAMSATALLQKAAQMGATATNASFLRGLGIVSSTLAPSGPPDWDRRQIEPESGSLAAGLGLGLPCDSSSGLKELMIGASSMFRPKQTTLSLLGLGVAASGGPTSDLSSLMTSVDGSGGLNVATAAALFGGGELTGKDKGRSS